VKSISNANSIRQSLGGRTRISLAERIKKDIRLARHESGRVPGTGFEEIHGLPHAGIRKEKVELEGAGRRQDLQLAFPKNFGSDKLPNHSRKRNAGRARNPEESRPQINSTSARIRLWLLMLPDRASGA
jgi:hypothetical protein